MIIGDCMNSEDTAYLPKQQLTVHDANLKLRSTIVDDRLCIKVELPGF